MPKGIRSHLKYKRVISTFDLGRVVGGVRIASWLRIAFLQLDDAMGRI